jgi:hypothetical protein
MQRESPLHRGERFAIEAHLLAQWLDAANYDVATFAEYLVDDDEGGKSPCFVHAWSFDAISDFRWLQRWTAVKDVGCRECPGFLTSVTSPKPMWVPTCKVASTRLQPYLDLGVRKTRQLRLSAEWMLG